MSSFLSARGLTKRFRGLTANEDVDFDLGEGEVQCLIGPNGAGKTTFLSMLSGHLTPSAGKITFQGRDITKLSVAARARAGIARKFQTPTVFDGLSAEENIDLAVLSRHADGNRRKTAVAEILELTGLHEERLSPARHLSHGQRQWLEIGLLLGISAKVLLLDEPTAGMTSQETAATGRLILSLSRERNLSVVVIEHDIHFIRELDSSVTVLHLGRVLKRGDFTEIAKDDQVREVYLGTAQHA